MPKSKRKIRGSKSKSDGTFDTKKEAAVAFDRAAIQTDVHDQIGYRGVRKEGKNFRAYIDIDGKNTSLGTYDTAKEAAVAHDVAALQAGRPRSILNFQDSARPIPTPDPPACAFKVYVFEHLAPIASSPSVAASVSVSSSSSGISSRRVIHSFDSYKNIPAELLRKRNIEICPLAQRVPEPTGSNAFLMAALKGHVEVVRLLLQQPNIELNKKSYGKSPLGWATQMNHTEIIQLLTDAGAQ